MIYAIIALVALAALCGWLIWQLIALRKALEKARARNQSLREDRAIRQNLQHVLERREAEIHRLPKPVFGINGSGMHVNMSLFRESGLRILAEKEDGVKRMKMEQLEHQLAEARNRLKDQEAKSRDALEKQAAQAEAEAEALRKEIADRDAEISRLQTLNARRLAKKAQQDGGGLDQMTIDDILRR